MATLVSIGWLATIVYADAIISPAGTGLIYTTGSSWVSYGLSRNGDVPTAFEWTNKRGVPWVGLIAAFVTGCICFLPFPSWQSLVGLITSASVLMYAGAPLSLGVFRRRLPEALRPYRLGIAILIGYLILALSRGFHLNDKPTHLNWRAAPWLPVYLVGMGVVVYISSFGPLKSPVLGDLSGILVVAVFSLAIYYWAMAVSLSGEEIEEMVNEVVLPEEEGLEMPAH